LKEVISAHISYIFTDKLQAIDDITSDNEFQDLHKFKLSEEDWNLLQDYEEILQVIPCFLLMKYVNIKILGSTCIPGYFEW